MHETIHERPREIVVAAALIGGAPVAAALGYLALSRNPDAIINEVVPEVVGFWVLCAVFIYIGQHAARTVALVAAVTEGIVILVMSLFVEAQLLVILSAVCIVHAAALFLLYRSPAKRWLDGTAPDAGREKPHPYNERGRVPSQKLPRRSATPLELVLLVTLFALFTAGIVLGIRIGDGLAVISGTILIALPLWFIAIGLGFLALALPWRWSTRLLAVVAGIATGPMALAIAISMAP
jgi:hypothetical protein